MLIELAKMVRKEGYRYIDLTPGGDEYKERFANTNQDLCRPTFYFSMSCEFCVDSVVGALVNTAKRIAIFSPSLYKKLLATKKAIDFFLINGGNFSLRSVINSVSKLLYDKSTYSCYGMDIEKAKVYKNPSVPMNVQKYQDLLKYEASRSSPSRHELLFQALKRFTAGDTLYSRANGDSLFSYAWMAKDGEKNRFPEIDAPFATSSPGFVFYDFYANPSVEGNDIYQSAIAKMVADARSMGAKRA